MSKLERTFFRPFRNFMINCLAASVLMPMRIRYIFYRLYGIRTETTAINPGCWFGGNSITIGKGTIISYNCFFDNTGPITIGENVGISFDVIFSTARHHIGDKHKRFGDFNDLKGLPITVQNGCWIGARATILEGVTISEGCIIAAGAVVNKDCSPNGLYAGVPAKRVKDLP